MKTEGNGVECVLGIDAGTTGITAALYTLNGEKLAAAYSELPSIYPKSGWVEQDAEVWWKTTVKVAKDTLSLVKGAVDVRAIAVTNQRETVVPISRSGKAIANAIVWQDRRCVDEVRVVENSVGRGEIFRITGLNPDPYFTLPKIMWWQRHRPEVYKRAWKFLLVHDFLVFRLCGAVITDHSNASRTMLMDLSKREWSEDIAEAVGIDLNKMPNLTPSGTVLGVLRGEVARALSVNKDTLAVSGGGDQQCSALGLGITGPGRAKSTTGTGTFILAPVDKRDERGMGKIVYSAHVVGDNGVVAEASIFSTGSVLSWVKKALFVGEGYDVLNKEAGEVVAGSNGLFVLPFFAGAGAPHWVPDARGQIYGLTLGHNRGDIARAVMEGVAFEVRTNIDVMRSLGINISELVLDGGAARSKVWNRIFANVCGVRCIVSSDVEATVKGAAILAASAIKGEKQEATVNTFISGGSAIQPDKDATARYNALYPSYVRLRDMALKSGLEATGL